jgi:DNA-binding NtrC family response regulator
MNDSRKTVLLVEDEPLVAAVAIDALDEIGFSVVDVMSAKAALDAIHARDGEFEFAIIDLGLPDRPGDQLVADIKRIRPDLGVIIASGYGSTPAALAGHNRLVMLAKPYDYSDLRTAIAKLGLAQI